MSQNPPANFDQLPDKDLLKTAQRLRERVQNPDWQAMMKALQVSDHLKSFREEAPPFIQRYIKLEIDLEAELNPLSLSAPLLSNTHIPRIDRNASEDMPLVAHLLNQDVSLGLRWEIMPSLDLTRVSFGVRGWVNLHYNFPKLDPDELRIFLDLFNRERGLCFLWTKKRWEGDFLIFVREELNTRLYAFSATHSATARLTHEVVTELSSWLGRAWFRQRGQKRSRRTTQMVNIFANPDVLLNMEASALAAVLPDNSEDAPTNPERASEPPSPALVSPPPTPVANPTPVSPPPSAEVPPRPVPSAGSPESASPAALSEETVQVVVGQLIRLDAAGRAALNQVAGEAGAETLKAIFTAPSAEALRQILTENPALIRQIQGVLGEKVTPAPPPAPVPKTAPPAETDPDSNPDVLTW